MKIIDDLLTVNEYSRSGEKQKEIKCVVMHWTANKNATEIGNRDYFEKRKTGTLGYGGAHYIIGQTGLIIRCIPEDEIAFHSGSSNADPKSGKIYTDECRARFGTLPNGNGRCPNNGSIGIELCNVDDDGNFSQVTVESAIELVADILRRHKLTVDAITTHHNLVGWKDCPRLWTNKPELLEAFKADVKRIMEI